MPQVALNYNEFPGLQLGIDRKRVPAPYVVDGRNFFVDVDGPVAGFGRRWRMYRDIVEPRGVQTLRNGTDDDVYWLTADAICEWDAVNRQLVPVYEHAVRTLWWPWTRARVGTFVYLCNKEIGIIRYCVSACFWEPVTGANVPPDPVAVCEVGGRLFVLAEELVAWSAIDDGSNAGLAPDTATGAGFQLLSMLAANARPLICLPYADGALSYTRAGILRSELRENSPNPFRHRPLSRTHAVLNPWCAVLMPNERSQDQPETQLFLTERGFFTTDGRERPVAWQPLISEYFHRTLLPTLDVSTPDRMTVRLDTIFKQNAITMSISEDSTNAIYTMAYVFYSPTQTLGVYNRAHCGFAEYGDQSLFDSAVVNVEGTAWSFEFTSADFGYPQTGLWQVDHRVPTDWPWQYALLNGESLAGTHMLIITEDPEPFSQAAVWNRRTEVASVFSPLEMPETEDSEWGATFAMQVELLRITPAIAPDSPHPLDAEILVGPIRIPDDPQLPYDLLTQTQSALIGMQDAGIADDTEDYLNDYQDIEVEEDWGVLDGSEDWGALAGDVVDYGVEFIGTLDGYAVWEADGLEQRITPADAEFRGRIRHVTGTITGHYCFMRLSAYELGQIFHLKTLRVNVTSAGRIL